MFSSLCAVDPDDGFSAKAPSSPGSEVTARGLMRSSQFDGSASPTARSLSLQMSPTYKAQAPNGPKVRAGAGGPVMSPELDAARERETLQFTMVMTLLKASFPLPCQVLESLSKGASKPYTVPTDRIGAAYTPTAAGLHKAR